MNQPAAWIDLGNDSAAVDDSGRLVGVARYIGNTNRPTEPIKAAREPTRDETNIQRLPLTVIEQAIQDYAIRKKGGDST